MRSPSSAPAARPGAGSSSRPWPPATPSPAVVRNPTRLPVRHHRLQVLAADVLDPAAIGPAVAGADAVISALGPHPPRNRSSVMSAATASILQAMRAAGTGRLVVVSAAPVATDDHGTTLPYRLLAAPMLRALLGGLYADMAVMEEAVRRSGTDWTILRRPSSPTDPAPGPTVRPGTPTCAVAPASPGPTWPTRSWPAWRTPTQSRRPSPSATEPGRPLPLGEPVDGAAVPDWRMPVLAGLGHAPKPPIQRACHLDLVQHPSSPANATSSCSWQLSGQPPSDHSRSPWIVDSARPWAVWVCRLASYSTFWLAHDWVVAPGWPAHPGTPPRRMRPSRKPLAQVVQLVMKVPSGWQKPRSVSGPSSRSMLSPPRSGDADLRPARW
jgi:hypothetical protein